MSKIKRNLCKAVSQAAQDVLAQYKREIDPTAQDRVDKLIKELLEKEEINN